MGRGGSLYVLAGVTGAGKSSIGGEMLRSNDVDYWNPDEVARELQDDEGLDLSDAQAKAWNLGREFVERTIEQRGNLAFETTLGARTMAGLLHKALTDGLAVTVWYAGLDSVDLHVARVQARVAAGGHDIPESKIRDRYERSHQNLAALAPRLTELWVYDNSVEASPELGHRPAPRLLLHCRAGSVIESVVVADAPDWLVPVLAAVGITR